MRRLFAFVLTVLVLTGIAAARADDLDTVISKKELTIGLVNQTPFAKFDQNTNTWSAANYRHRQADS
jgi:hypothetical protein